MGRFSLNKLGQTLTQINRRDHQLAVLRLLRMTSQEIEELCRVFTSLFISRENAEIRVSRRRRRIVIPGRYVHIATGNYNPTSSSTYTDFGILTADEETGEDATEFFNFLTGHSKQTEYRKLMVSPVNLRERLTQLIERETAHAKLGRPARIVAKLNRLADKDVIESLYEASQAGVSIDLIIRGVCMLRPGVPGLSENIRVRSIVGRFLEHSRVLYFVNDGAEEVYMGSADWMVRNLNRRVEVVTPV